MGFTPQTRKHRTLNDHIQTGSGTKTICVSTALSYFGIAPDEYRNTSSNKNVSAFIGVLRRKGYSVRSQRSKLRLKKRATTTQCRKALKKSDFTPDDLFIFWGSQKYSGHVIVMNGEGETIIDTAPRKKWKLVKILLVEPK